MLWCSQCQHRVRQDAVLQGAQPGSGSNRTHRLEVEIAHFLT